VLADNKGGPPSASLIANLLRLANNLGQKKTITTLLHRVAAAEQGHYGSWQLAALAALLDTLDQRNTTLARLAQEGDETLKGAVEQLSGLFASARLVVADMRHPQDERLQAIRLLGRGLDHRQEDRELLVKLLVPQTEPELKAAAVANLGRLRDDRVPEDRLRGWKGDAPAVRSSVLEVLRA